MCPYLSVWTCPLGMDCGGRMSQVDRVAGSLNTSKHTHTHVCLLARRQAHRKCPCGCQPPPIVWHTGEEWEEGEGRCRGTECGVGGEVGTQKEE